MEKTLFLLSILSVKLVGWLIHIFHLGQASNFPGKIALKINKDLLKFFKFKELAQIIFITGTNGKSTTCGLLASILQASHKKVIYNKSGANLLSGIATTLCHYADFLGKLNYDYIILEVDEATLPNLTLQLKPYVIAVTNLFRDQLDRFGELDTTAKLIEQGINNNTNIKVILNTDDSRVAFLETKNKKIYYGIDANAPPCPPRSPAPTRVERGEAGEAGNDSETSWLSDPEEVTVCPECKSDLNFTKKFLAHLGNYKCTKCNLYRVEPDYKIVGFKTDNLTINFDVVFDKHKINFFLSMIGIFNLYNALCSIAIAKTITNDTLTTLQIQKGFQTYSTIFGRGEKIKINNKIAWIYLIKNPTGTTEVLKTLATTKNARFLIAINDNLADGRDVSWLWDARFDVLSVHNKEIYVSGKRAYDMALRLKYANVPPNLIKVAPEIKEAVREALKSMSNSETLYILPTYTVLLEMQKKKLCKEQPLS